MLSEIKEVSMAANTPLQLTVQEKRSVENQANMVSIIRTVEHLEKGFVNGYIKNDDYEKHCSQLISQFKVVQAALREKYPDFGAFWAEFKLDCPFARARLLETGMAATLLHNTSPSNDASAETVHVFESGQHLSTLIDSLKLNMRAVDEILPTLKELLTSVSKIATLPMDTEGRDKLQSWLLTLNQMTADDTLSESQARQFAMDLESFYIAFHKWLKEKR